MAKQQIVTSLSEKVARVIAENTRLEKQQAAMEADLVRLRSENRALREKLNAAEKQVALHTLGEGLAAREHEHRSIVLCGRLTVALH